MQAMPIRAITFDAGQTLIELDTEMLARRLAERGVSVEPAALDAAVPDAWRAYDRAVVDGARHPWHLLMHRILEGALEEEPTERRGALVDWLWSEQPRQNLWRKPIAGMIELVDALRAAGVAVAVVSNSEGALAELFAEIGWAGRFAVIADSGRLGVEKPDPAIFDWTLAQLEVAPAAAVHVGDSYAADVVGARRAGLRAVWFGRHAVAGAGSISDADRDAIATAADATELTAALARWGVPR